MTGSIYDNGRGRMVAAIDIGPPGGKRIRRTRSVRIADYPTVDAARRAAEDVLDQLTRAYDTPTQVKTVGQALGLWERHLTDQLADGDLQPSTVDGYRRQLRRQVLPHLGSRPLASLTPADVMAWQRWMAAEGLSKATRARTLRTLKTALKWCVKMQLVDSNAADPVDPPKHRADAGRAASVEEVRRLLGHPCRNRHLYAVMAGLGLRVGEAVGLAWDDVDLTGNVVTVGHQVQRELGEWTRKPTKTGTIRVVPLPRFLVDHLAQQRAAQTSAQVQAESLGLPWDNPWGLVFTNAEGGPLYTTGVARSLRRDCKAADVAHLSPHDLRRSCSSLLASLGVPVTVRMAVLGHSTSRLTEDVYTRAYDPDVRRAMDDLSDALDGGKPEPR